MNPAATTVHPATAARCRAFARGAGFVAVMAGGLVLVGWAFDLDWLKGVFRGSATMRPNTAVGFMLSGVAMFLLSGEGNHRLAFARLCAALAATLGWLTVAEYLLGLNLGLDDLLFHASVHNSTDLNPGRMVPATALGFSLVGVSLLIRDARQRFSIYVSDSLALATALVGLLALLGYIFGVKSLYQVATYSSMALHTALLFFALGLGALAVRPATGLMAIIITESDGGVIARRILPFTVVLPMFFGWLQLQGQRAGYFGPEFGLAIFALVNIAAFSVLIWIGARGLNRLAASRRESEEKFSTSFDSSTIGLSITTTEGKFVKVNEAFCELIGYGPTEILGRSSTDLGLLSVPDRGRILASLQANCGSARNAEVQFRTKSGQMRDILYSVGPILLNGVQHRLFTGLDVTERKQTEQALREREQQLRLFVEYCPASVVMFDRDMKYLAVSRRWRTDYNLGEQPVVGRNHHAVFPNLPERWQEICRRCLGGAVEKCEQELFTRADGTTEWIRWEIRPWHEAQDYVGGIILFSEVITTRKRAEGRLRRLVDSNVQGVIFWNKQGEITEANDAFLRLVGYTRDDLAAGLISWVAMTPPEYAQLDQRALAEIAATGVCTPVEKEYIRKDGTRVPILAAGASLDDNPNEGVSFVLDITTLKQGEAALSVAHAHTQLLAQRLLEAQENERRQVARDLHDELGQIMTAVKINLQTIQQRPEGAHFPLGPSIDLVDRALQQTRAMSLSLRPPLLDDLGLVPAVRWLADQQSKLTGQRITLATDLPAGRMAPMVETTCFRLAQEAVTNALRHAHSTTITLGLRATGAELHLTVSDDGDGFDLAAIRAKALRGGSLGLLGMEERAMLAGGHVDWDSVPGRGTVVRARFPLSPGQVTVDNSAR